MAVALTMRAVAADMSVRFWQTAQLVLELGNAKRKGTLSKLLNDVSPARLLVLDEFVYVPCDVDGARVLYQVISVHVVLVGRGVVGLVEGEGLRPVPVGPRPGAPAPAGRRRLVEDEAVAQQELRHPLLGVLQVVARVLEGARRGPTPRRRCGAPACVPATRRRGGRSCGRGRPRAGASSGPPRRRSRGRGPAARDRG